MAVIQRLLACDALTFHLLRGPVAPVNFDISLKDDGAPPLSRNRLGVGSRDLRSFEARRNDRLSRSSCDSAAGIRRRHDGSISPIRNPGHGGRGSSDWL